MVSEKIREQLKSIFVESRQKYLNDSDVVFYLYLVKYCNLQKSQKVYIHMASHALKLRYSKQQVYRKLNLLVEIKAITKHHKNGSALYIEILQPKELLSIHGIKITTSTKKSKTIEDIIALINTVLLRADKDNYNRLTAAKSILLSACEISQEANYQKMNL